MTKIHPLLNGVYAGAEGSRGLCDTPRLFEQLYESIRTNWISNRVAERWPSQSNWILRTAPEFAQYPTHYLEKQLQKNIAILLLGTDEISALVDTFSEPFLNARKAGFDAPVGIYTRFGQWWQNEDHQQFVGLARRARAGRPLRAHFSIESQRVHHRQCADRQSRVAAEVSRGASLPISALVCSSGRNSSWRSKSSSYLV